MQIQSINNVQHSKKQSFGAHFNFTKTGKKFVSDLAKGLRMDKCTLEPYENWEKQAKSLIKGIDKSLDKDMVITLDKFEDNKYQGTLSKGPYKTDFEFDNQIKENYWREGVSYFQLEAMGSALKRAAEDLRDSGKNLFGALRKRLELK